MHAESDDLCICVGFKVLLLHWYSLVHRHPSFFHLEFSSCKRQKAGYKANIAHGNGKLQSDACCMIPP